MTWPSTDSEVLLGASLTGSPSTWANWGTLGGSATISGSPTIENGGVTPTLSTDDISMAVSHDPLASDVGLTMAVRYLHANTSDISNFYASFIREDNSSFRRFQICAERAGGFTKLRAYHRGRWGGSAWTSSFAPAVADLDTQQVMVLRVFKDGSDWKVTLYDTAGGTADTSIQSLSSVTSGDLIRIASSTGSSSSTVGANVTGLAFWYSDIGDAAAGAISPSDSEWTTAPDSSLSGSATISVTASGDLSQTVNLSGSATISVTGSGNLDSGAADVNLSGSATISVTAAGDLTQTLGFSGSATISVGGSGSIGGTIALSGEAAIVSMNGVGKLRLVLYEFRAEGLNTRGMAWGHRNLREGGVNRRDMLPWKFYNSGAKEGGTYYVMTDGSIVEKADNSLPDSGTVYTSAELGRDAVFPGGRATQVDRFEKVSLEAGGFSSSIGEVVNQ